jgi:thiamine-phosphate pyrophosphorylase
MKLVVISPEQDDPRETTVLGELFSAGLERYHVRRPAGSREQLARWLDALPPAWRSHLVLHQHHDLVAAFGLSGSHWRDDGAAPALPGHDGRLTSRSCHDLATARQALGRYDSVFLSPVFSSLSKPGHRPRGDLSHAQIAAWLAGRTVAERRTSVLALGGLTAETAPAALALGFDGVAVLGAIWQATDPVRAFVALQDSLLVHAA